MPVFAAVDIGSNSVRLSIAELIKGRLVALHQDREGTRLGAVRLTQEFLRHDPPRKEELKRLHDFIAEEVARIPPSLRQTKGGIAVATSGTAAALAEAAHSLKLSRTDTSLNAVSKLLQRLARLNVKQRATIRGINSKRAEIIIAGAAVYEQVLRTCGLRGFRYSALGLRDGI